MPLSRRDFLKTTAATTIAAGGLTLFGTHEVFGKDTTLIPSACHWGPFKAVVKKGVLVGIQPLPELDATPTTMLTKGVLSRVYSKTRVAAPMVRKSWLSRRGADAATRHLRGHEPFVQVSWDEALALVAEAILSTAEQHGNQALFSSSYGGWSHAGLMRPQVLQGRLFGLIGGHSTTTGDYSGGASQISLPYVIGDMEVYSPQTSWEVLAAHTDIMVWVGADPIKNNRIEYTVADHQMTENWKKIRARGVKFISINPQYTATDELLQAEWIKIVPNTDTALFLAMAFHVLSTGRQDQAYLAKYTVGFERFRDYLLGRDADGSPPKTPEWAAAITGVPAAQIRTLAELFSGPQRVQFAGAWSLQRAHHGEMTHWAIINFAAMVGKIGKPGQGVGFSWHYGGGGMVQSNAIMPVGLSQGRNPVTTRCPASRISEMLLNPGGKYTRDGSTHSYPDVRLIYNAGNNFLSHQQNTNELIRALNRQVPTIICQDPWWCASARFADIVLPATSELERNDISSGGTYSNDKIYAMRQVIQPYGQSLDDLEIFSRLAGLMGVGYQFTEGKSIMQILTESFQAAQPTLSFQHFWREGVARLPVPQEMRGWVRHGDFYRDPEQHPLHTRSGKIELYCAQIDSFKLPDCPPMPKYLEPAEFLGNAKPGQVHVVSPHPWNRVHSQMAQADVRFEQNVQGRQHVLINPQDAAALDIRDGDLVELSNARGTLIAGAAITARIMQGVVSLEEGNWIQLDSRGRCNSGSINMITSSIAASALSQASSANTCLATLRRCDDAESPNRAYEPPAIERIGKLGIQVAALRLAERAAAIKGQATTHLSPGEKLFYERCTLCHVPREPGDYTQKQWLGITESMFPRAGLDEGQKKSVLEFLLKHARDAAPM